MLKEPPQGQGFVEHEMVGIALLAVGLGVAIAGSLRDVFVSILWFYAIEQDINKVVPHAAVREFVELHEVR